jgi:hypothetical protein
MARARPARAIGPTAAAPAPPRSCRFCQAPLNEDGECEAACDDYPPAPPRPHRVTPSPAAQDAANAWAASMGIPPPYAAPARTGAVQAPPAGTPPPPGPSVAKVSALLGRYRADYGHLFAAPATGQRRLAAVT